jgi:predicted ATP-dependent endonuclease of OLD family
MFDTIDSPEIAYIKIKNLYGNRNIEWNLNPFTNILIDAKINKRFNIFEDFGLEYKDVEIEFNSINLNTILLNTFDTVYKSVSECKESCANKLSLLDSQLLALKNQFSEYQLKFKNRFEEENLDNRREIDRILNNIENGNINEADKIQALRKDEKRIKKKIYNKLNIFKKIIDSMFNDTNKKINLDSTQKASSILSKNKELDMLELSSGEKQILIIFLTILLKEDELYILMMDEPENSLHSECQIHFVENIRRLNKNIQIIIATHNPLLR